MRRPAYGITCRFTTISDPSELPVGDEAIVALHARHPQLDIHIYWQAMTYLLTGETEGVGGGESLYYLVKGGERLGDTDAGPVRYLSPQQVAQFSSAISDFNPDDFGEQRYDLADLDAKGIYPRRWRADGEENDLLSNIRELFSYLQGYLREVVVRGHGVIVSYENTELYFDDDDE